MVNALFASAMDATEDSVTQTESAAAEVGTSSDSGPALGDPVSAPVDPVSAPVDPVSAPTDPVSAPTVPVSAPVDLVSTPVGHDSTSIDPVSAPADVVPDLAVPSSSQSGLVSSAGTVDPSSVPVHPDPSQTDLEPLVKGDTSSQTADLIPEPADPDPSPSQTKLATVEKEVASLGLDSPSDSTEVQTHASPSVTQTHPLMSGDGGSSQIGQASETDSAQPKQPYTGDYLPLEEPKSNEDTASTAKEPSSPEKHQGKKKKKKKHSSRAKDEGLVDSSSNSHSDRLSEQINNAATRAITNGRYCTCLR